MSAILSVLARLLAPLAKPFAHLFGGWFVARQTQKRKDAEANVKTRERIDNADIVGDDPDAARRWLSERARSKR